MRLIVAALLLTTAVVSAVSAAEANADANGPDATTIQVVYLALAPQRVQPKTVLDPVPTDEGLQGARLGVTDDQTTGVFTGQHFELQERVVADVDAAVAAAQQLLVDGHQIFVTDLPAAAMLRVADLPGAKNSIVMDATSVDDELRGADCRANVLHLPPSRAMLADTLMQYLAVKRWRNLLLVTGLADSDRKLADAFRRSAGKFQLRIVADKPWTFKAGAQRTDTGHVSIGAEAARFTQGIAYDMLVVADTNGDFGDNLAFRSADPRPVAGTQGMVPTAWAQYFEQWGATQLQLRFQKLAGRWMTRADYGSWMALRAIGEAATRGGSNPTTLIDYLRSPKFELAAFKGSRLTFRAWDGQLRQPVLLADARGLISVSPQPGYLHQFSELDTLGIDQPETACRK